MLTLLIALFSLIVLMVIHEFGHFFIAKKFGVKVEEFGIGYPPRIFGKKIGETIYSLNWIPFGAFVRIHGEETNIDDYRSFSSLAIYKRILIVLGGVIAFWLAAIIIFSVAFSIGASVPIGDQDIENLKNIKIQVMAVNQGSPAHEAGLQLGDELVGFNKVADFQTFVQDNKGKPVTLTIKRNGQEVQTMLTPRTEYPPDQGPTGVVLERMADLIKKYPWYQAPIQGTIYTGKVTWEATRGLYTFFADIFTGKGVPSGAAFAGPVGITIFLSRAVGYGLGFFLYFIGSLSVLLAIFNLFPIPALDGGKLAFLIIEKIRKKPISTVIEQRITIAFFVILITLSIFITIKFDIPRVVDLWKASL